MISIIQFIVFICFIIYSFIQAVSFGIYVLKENKNAFGAYSIFAVSILAVFLPLFAILKQ